MYTRAKEIGGKVMAGGENRMMQPAASRCGQVYGHLSVWPMFRALASIPSVMVSLLRHLHPVSVASKSAFLLQFVCKYPIFCAIDDNFCNYSDTPYFRTPVKEFLPFFFIFQEIPVIAHFSEIIIIVHLLIISHSSNFPFMIVIFY